MNKADNTYKSGKIIDPLSPLTAALLNFISTMIQGKKIGILKTGIKSAPLLVLEASAESM